MTQAPFYQHPSVVLVELTNHCNLRCPCCTNHTGMERERGFMAFSLFLKLLADLEKHLCRPTISFNMCGEPLLHPEVVRFVEESSRRGFATFISTNACRLTAELASGLVRAGLGSILLCVDGATARAHEAMRVGSSFQQVKQHCEAFLRVRCQMNSVMPHVTIQTLLTAYSEGELADVAAWAWDSGADEVWFKSLSLGSHATVSSEPDHPFLPRDPRLRRGSGPLSSVCQRPLEQSLVYWNGDLGICCVDFNNFAKLPSMAETSFFECFHQPEMIAARMKGCQREYRVCRRCRSGAAEFSGFRLNLTRLRLARTPDMAEPDWAELISGQLATA